jgi:hypothetical protein
VTVTDPIFEAHEFRPHPRTAYGAILSGFEVEHAVATTVRVWFRDYLAELERQRHLEVGRLPVFRSLVQSSSLSKMPEDQLPALLIASSGVESRERVEVNSDGWYTARFRVDCGAVVSARGNRLAVTLARYYTAGLRAMLLQQLADPRWSGLEGIRRVVWVTEDYRQLGDISERTQGGGIARFVVEVEHVTNWVMGPDEPTEPPEPELRPIATSVHVTVEKEE